MELHDLIDLTVVLPNTITFIEVFVFVILFVFYDYQTESSYQTYRFFWGVVIKTYYIHI